MIRYPDEDDDQDGILDHEPFLEPGHPDLFDDPDDSEIEDRDLIDQFTEETPCGNKLEG